MENITPAIKDEIIDMISRLPEGADHDDIIAEIYFKQKVDESLQQIEEGKVVSHEEAKILYQNDKIIDVKWTN
jgi:hypothetical protein